MDHTVKVLKFGGTSVGDIPSLHHCASLIQKQLRDNRKLVVVVSAMGSQTDELLKLAFSVSDSPPQRELDMLLSTGERVSCALLAMSLERIQVKAISLTGSQCGILTDKVHQHAEIIDIKCDRILSSFQDHDVVIVAGFQGVDPQSKEITTLGRGGSDLTAVALAHKLKAASCSIYTDVDGIWTLDPKAHKEGHNVPSISWLEAYQLSCAGAKVLHYRAAAFALKHEVPLKILNTKNPEGPHTKVGKEEATSFFLSQKKDQAFIEVSCESDASHTDFFSEVLSFLWKYDGVPSLCEQISLSEKRSKFRFVLGKGLVSKLEDFLRRHQDYFVTSLKTLEDGFTSVSLLGYEGDHSDLKTEIESDLAPQSLTFFSKEEGILRFGVQSALADSFVVKFYSLLKAKDSTNGEKR